MQNRIRGISPVMLVPLLAQKMFGMFGKYLPTSTRKPYFFLKKDKQEMTRKHFKRHLSEIVDTRHDIKLK
jgi:hypothetical protein